MGKLFVRVLVVVLACSGALGAGAAPASAHAELVSTEPAYGAGLPEPPARVLLRYAVPVEVSGARATLASGGRRLPVAKPVYGSRDHRNVSVGLPDELGPGSYLLTWYLFATDGDVMGGELVFTVGQTGPAPASVPTPAVPQEAEAGSANAPPTPGPPCSEMASEPVPGSPCYVEPGLEPAAGTEETVAPPVALPAPSAGTPDVRSFVPLSQPQEAARWLGYASIMVLVGTVAFVLWLWPSGALLARTRTLLKVSLIGALVATVATLGLKGAALSGKGLWSVLSPDALTALEGTHPGRTLVARLVLLGLAVPVVAYLAWVPERARRSVTWGIAAAVTIGGAVFTHSQLSHGYADGSLAAAVDVVHLGALSVWLGGLVVLGGVVLPRRRRDELARLVPRFSKLAFVAVSTATVAGTVLLLLLSPRWGELPGTAYGRYLFVKLGLVVVVLAAAARSRSFVRRRLAGLTTPADDDPDATRHAPTGERIAVSVGAGPGLGQPSAAGRGAPAEHRPEVDEVSLRPFVTSVMAELGIAAAILGATALLVGRSVPT